MKLLFVNNWIADETLNALGWTLFHSLWIGLLAAVASGIIIITTRKSTARLRYNLLTGVMFLFLVGCIASFFVQVQVPALNTVELQDASTNILNPILASTEYGLTNSKNVVDRFKEYFNTNASLIVFIWLIFFVVHCIKLLSGLAGVHRLRSHRVSMPADQWMTRVNELSNQLGIRQSVTLLQSELIKVPVAVGFLKPAILVPIGLLSNLPPEQVEAILLHELAHIRRKDYLINLVQRFAEAVFFFNPSFMWLCSLIRQEREACCDDVVVATTGQKRDYLEALVSFQEYSLASQGYVMAIKSKQNYLLNRVKRLLTRENKKLNAMEKLLLLFGLIVFTAFTIKKEEVKKNQRLATPFVINQPVETREPVKIFVEKTVEKARDTVPPKNKPAENDIRQISSNVNIDGNKKTETINATAPSGKKYTIVRVNDKLTSLKIDDKVIPENEFGNYSSAINQIDEAREKNRLRKMKEKENKKAQLVNNKIEKENKIKEKNKEMDEKMKTKIEIADKKKEESIQKKIDAKRKELEADIKVLDTKRKELSDIKNEINIKKNKLEAKEGKEREDGLKEIKNKEKLANDKLKEIENKKNEMGGKKEEIGKEKEKLENIKEKEKERKERVQEKEDKRKAKEIEEKKKTSGSNQIDNKRILKENKIALKQEDSHTVSANVFNKNSSIFKNKVNADVSNEVHIEKKTNKSEWDLQPNVPGWQSAPASLSAPASPGAPPKKLFNESKPLFKKSGSRIGSKRVTVLRTE